MAKPAHWTETNISAATLGEPIAKQWGWTFYEHPTKGDEAPLLATSKAYGGRTANGLPIIYDTHEFDIPEYL